VNPKCHYYFVFSESDPDRHNSLIGELKARYPRQNFPSNVHIVTEQTDFVDLVRGISAGAAGRRLIPLFAFIDPFGYKGIPLESLNDLLGSPGSEVLAYLDVRSLLRFAGKGNVDDHFSALLGGNEFLAAPPPGSAGRAEFFTRTYQEALRGKVGFRYTWSFLMRNARNQPMYALVYATRNVKGLEVMKDAMWKAAPDGSYSFVAGRSGQQVLLGDETHVDVLARQLVARFSGMTVPIEDIEEFVLVETDYRLGVLKRKTLTPMQRDGLLTTNRARRGSFTAGTLVTFR
jgi:three-Cys-motif partner protein